MIIFKYIAGVQNTYAHVITSLDISTGQYLFKVFQHFDASYTVNAQKKACVQAEKIII